MMSAEAAFKIAKIHEEKRNMKDAHKFIQIVTNAFSIIYKDDYEKSIEALYL